MAVYQLIVTKDKDMELSFTSGEALKAGQDACARIRGAYAEASSPSYYIESYGCQMNAHDSERIAGMLHEAGYTEALDKLSADLILYNTCCVRDHAEKRVFGNIGALRKLKEEKPGLIIAVCGCMMQQAEVANRMHKRFKYVDLIFGAHELNRFPVLLEKVLSGERVISVAQTEGDIIEGLPVLRNGRFSTSLIIMYGCNNFCTYCIVPYVRGRERSREPEAILTEARQLAQSGYKEVTLLGQNVNSYRSSNGMLFPQLLELIDSESNIERIRFMTSHPKDLSPDLIRAMAGLKHVCKHIHLPVQSGSSRILRLMNRGYDRVRYMSVIKSLRDSVPNVEITTDVIVGFPGETEDDFNQTLSLVEETGFSAAYTFMYSPRSGTKAAAMEGQIDDATKKRRLSELNALVTKTIKRNNVKYIQTTGEVLVEGYDMRNEPMAYGKLSNFKMVYFPAQTGLIGQTVNVKIESARNNSLFGTIIG